MQVEELNFANAKGSQEADSGVGKIPILQLVSVYLRGGFMTKEVVKHRKEEKKKPVLTAKEKRAKKKEKKLGKG